MSIKKSEFNLQVNDTTARAYLAAPENGGPGVLVLHAWWGLKPFFKQVCDQLAEQGFTALAPDYYQGRVAATIEEAKAMLEQRDEELMGDTIKTAHDHLAAQTSQPIATLGFSMGASWALLVAANEPDVAATVMFYGAGEADYTKLNLQVLGHFAGKDEWEDEKYIRAMEDGMQAAGLGVRFHFYPNTSHWFFENDRPEFNPDAAKLAWSRTLEFLRK